MFSSCLETILRGEKVVERFLGKLGFTTTKEVGDRVDLLKTSVEDTILLK